MTIEVLKSKISHIKVSSSTINSCGVIKMTQTLMDELIIRNYEKVFIFNESSRTDETMKTAFVEAFNDEHHPDTITTPISIAGAGDEITIISMGRVSSEVNSAIKPVILNMNDLII